MTSVRDVTHGYWLNQQGIFAVDRGRGRLRLLLN
jgi:hypothetical protein